MSGALGGAGLQLFEPRNAAAALIALLAIYTIGFLCFRPAAITIADEGTYVRQAQLIAAGTTGVEIVDPFTGAPTELRPINRYPLGTALLLLPFVSLGGREAASLLSLLCTVAGVALTARWLYEQDRSPLFAVLVLAYPATIVMGRVAMSEAPSLACVSLGLWLYGRGLGRGGWPWLGAGFAAGFSFALRESNVLLFAPLFAGSLLRRDPGVPALVVGGLLGTSVRFLASWLFFGDPFFVKPPDEFSPGAILSNAPIYLFCLLVLVPGGLVAAFAYRGPRRPEIVATVVLFVLFYLSYTYSAGPSGWAKRLVLGPRYFIPLLPVLSLCAAEVWPRLAARFRDRAGAVRAAGIGSASALVALAVVLVGVQWAHAGWTREQAGIRDAIEAHTEPGSVIVTNWTATGKFIDLVAGERTIVPRDAITSAHAMALLRQNDSFYVVFLDRSDTEFWRRNAMENALFLGGIRSQRETLLDEQVTPTDRLRIWRVTR